MPNIVLVDDHHVVRQGLKAWLETEPEFKVVGEASNGLEALQLVERLQPDILIVDLMMGGMNGLEVTRQVASRSRQTATIILSMHSNEAYVLEALQAGAKAYVLKESTSDELVHAVREAMAGHRFLSASLCEKAIDAYLQKSETSIVDPYDTLTSREREVLHMAAQGSTNTEVAKALFISRRTVEAHRTNMMKKLSLHNQTDLIRYAIQRGILPEKVLKQAG